MTYITPNHKYMYCQNQVVKLHVLKYSVDVPIAPPSLRAWDPLRLTAPLNCVVPILPCDWFSNV